METLEGRKGFFERIDFARRVLIATIENGWDVGLGPDSSRYDDWFDSLTFT